MPAEPCASSELVHFRHRIGEEGVELIFKESVRINGDDANDKDIYIDTTVQEKNITYPTDDKLTKKIIRKCWKIAQENDIKLRQSYTRRVKELSYDQRFRNHPRNKKKAKRADKKIKTIAGRLVRDIERKLGHNLLDYQELFDLFKQILAQQKKTTIRSIQFMNLMYNVSVKGKSIKSLNLVIKFLSLEQGLE